MMNKVMLIGRMARAPEIKRFDGGGTLANLRVITHRAWKDKATGEMRERSDGHTVVIHSAAAAERLAAQLRTGDMVMVEGLLENRSWTTREGGKQWITEVVIRPGLGSVRRLVASSKHIGEVGTSAAATAAAVSLPAQDSPAPASTETTDPLAGLSLDTGFDDLFAADPDSEDGFSF